eukprot:364262-Chlamydomonas_euryale.AAC.2
MPLSHAWMAMRPRVTLFCAPTCSCVSGGAGTSTSTWRRCWAMWRVRGRCLSDGWHLSPTMRAGTRTSSLRCDTRSWTVHVRCAHPQPCRHARGGQSKGASRKEESVVLFGSAAALTAVCGTGVKGSASGKRGGGWQALSALQPTVGCGTLSRLAVPPSLPKTEHLAPRLCPADF